MYSLSVGVFLLLAGYLLTTYILYILAVTRGAVVIYYLLTTSILYILAITRGNSGYIVSFNNIYTVYPGRYKGAQ